MGTSQAVGYTAALALAIAALYLILGLLRMGWVSTFLSKAVMAGFILGFSIGIIIDQSSKLFGLEAASGSYAKGLWETLGNLPDTSLTTLAVAAVRSSCSWSCSCRRWSAERWPGGTGPWAGEDGPERATRRATTCDSPR